jgi:hypothetical protein
MMWGLASLVQHAPYQHVCVYCKNLINDGLTQTGQMKGSLLHLDVIHTEFCCCMPIFDECRVYTDGCALHEDNRDDVALDLDNTCKEVYTFFNIDSFHIAYMCCRKNVVRVSTSNSPAADIKPVGNDNALDAGR